MPSAAWASGPHQMKTAAYNEADAWQTSVNNCPLPSPLHIHTLPETQDTKESEAGEDPDT